MSSDKTPPQDGMRAPTLRDIADRVGVSLATVSAILNEAPTAPNFSEDTRREVKAAAAALGYKINPLARALRRTRSGVLGCILFNHFDIYYARASDDAENFAKERGYQLVVSSMGYDFLRFEACIGQMAAWRVEGLLLLFGGRAIPADVADVLNSLKVPFVCGDAEDEGGAQSISRFSAHSGMLIAEHLYNLGHRDIAVVGMNARNLHSEERLRGMREYLVQRQVVLAPELCSSVPDGLHGPNAGHRCAQQIIEGGNRFTAMVCMNDLIAIGALAALRERDIRVPEACSVVGFDDLPLDREGSEENRLTRYTAPPLTTVRLPMREICREAMRRLVSKVERNEAEAAYNIEQQPKLIVRESTSPPQPSNL